FYNSLTRSKEKFESIAPGYVKMYVCGPTVYRYVHIGNLRTWLMADLIRRVLEYNDYAVEQIMNITDVGHMAEDDSLTIAPGEAKVLAAAIAEKKTPAEIAAFYTTDFLEALAEMNIKSAHQYPKATDHIPQMLTLIEELERKGLAYEKNGAVYYDVSRFENYGRLSKHAQEDLQAGIHRVEIDQTKDDPNDFLLWRVAGEHRLEKWSSKWGDGFPGWHIECSAMAMHYLGSQIDIHTGGEDLIFPHQRAQAVAFCRQRAAPQRFARARCGASRLSFIVFGHFLSRAHERHLGLAQSRAKFSRQIAPQLHRVGQRHTNARDAKLGVDELPSQIYDGDQ
ncbi:MAG: cysteine--tRNA ligase, partial [Chloroflexi bacterium]|nr:cysteine--tRNA ligase [Chloroflexota bacterium]